MRLIELSILIAFFVNGLNVLFSEGNLLGFVSRWWEQIENNYFHEESTRIDNILYWITKPIIGCMWCFCSFWGISLSLITQPYHELNLLGILISAVVAIPISQVIYKAFE